METATFPDAPGNTCWPSDKNCRPLHWRYAAAHQAVAEGETGAVADAGLEVIISFERAMRRCQCSADIDRVARAWPGLAAANWLSTAVGPIRSEVEARILAEQDDFVIAAQCGLTQETVFWYEATFYAVRARLRNRAWIEAWALDPAGQGGPGWLWRTFGYYGGPPALEIILAVTRGMPLPTWAMPTQMNDWPAREAQLRLMVKLIAAAERAPTAAELLDFIGTFERAA